MCVLFEFRQLFFYSGNLSTYFKVFCRSLQNTRCLAVSIQLEFEVGRFGFLKEERNSVVIHR